MFAVQHMRSRSFLSVLLSIALLATLGLQPARSGIDWVTGGVTTQPRVHLYFFWSQNCPHCLSARPFVESLDEELDWLLLHSYELNSSRNNVQRYIDMAEQLGREARSVPAFFICGRMLTGYDGPGGIGAQLRALAELCRSAPMHRGGAQAATGIEEPGPIPESTQTLSVPVFGTIDAGTLSLPLFTLAIASLDAFNPCAFFVLLFLLSLMVHARSRPRMLLVGGTFVFFSGLVYFLFMAAWLNLFLVVGGAPWVTLIAGLVALTIGVINVKDFFLFRQGPSLSIPDGAKPGLFKRMRGLLGAENLGTMMIGTVTLALAANSYELLCTAGFPMVYTRVLTLNALSGWEYYGWLVAYNLIYVLPLLAIVLLFTFTLGARKLSERQGLVLKLLSGTMMVGLGLVMLFAPEALNSLWMGAGLLLLAAVVTTAAALLTREKRVGEASPQGAPSHPAGEAGEDPDG